MTTASPPQAPPEPYFHRSGDLYTPGEPCRGPWSRETLSGRALCGALAHALETRFGDPAFLPCRLTVDMYRAAPFAPLVVRTTPVREGGRLLVADAEVIIGEVSVARASCQFLRTGKDPDGRVWSAPNWDAPAPEDVPAPELPPGAPDNLRAARMFSGQMGAAVRRRAWLKELREIAPGEGLTPFLRVALAADFTSPFSNSGDAGLGFINTDVTLYMHRPPRGVWVGIEVSDHQSAEGVSVSACRYYDAEGPIGAATTAALAQSRPIGGPALQPAGAPSR